MYLTILTATKYCINIVFKSFTDPCRVKPKVVLHYNLIIAIFFHCFLLCQLWLAST